MTRAPRDCKDPTSPSRTVPSGSGTPITPSGGPACLIRTLEGTTGIVIDHFMVLNFLGFQSMVDALGSVEVCVPTAINDS
jgi:anionic cell wall polymer biosynthesis LytR-Cps2A-Psr (LCP) family protein